MLKSRTAIREVLPTAVVTRTQCPSGSVAGSNRDERYANLCMVTYNRLEFTRQSIASILRHTRFPFVLTVVDNHSTDGTREYLHDLQQQGAIHNLLLLDENIGVAKAANIGWLLERDCDYYVKIDNDIVLQKDRWLEEMIAIVDRNPQIGAIGYNFEPRSYRLRALGPFFRRGRDRVRIKHNGNIGGACILIPARTRDKIGYWSEDYGLYGEEDSDYGLRLRLSGLLSVYMPDENIGLHLPAGRAAVIDPDTFEAKDGAEESIHADYRLWKDRQRRENKLGIYRTNKKLYKAGEKPLYQHPRLAEATLRAHPVNHRATCTE